MTQPPSFEPRRRGKRPTPDGASAVGRPGENERRASSGQRSSDADSRNSDTTSRQGPTPPVRRSAFSNRTGERPQYRDGQQRSDRGAPPMDQTQVQRTHAGANVPPPSYPPAAQAGAQAGAHASQPAPQPGRPPVQPRPGGAHGPAPQRPSKPKRRRSLGKTLLTLLLVFVIVLGAWAGYLYAYGNGRLDKVDALSGAAPTPGTTFLIVGSDERGEDVDSPVEGGRADTIMLLHQPDSGPTALVSLPRDTLVTYPGTQNRGKLNGTYSYGGPEYLVLTVEELTGLTIDSYIEIGMDGVKDLTNAVGGIELCLDYDVSDSFSGLEWTAGCHRVEGDMALAFSRMRYSDPLGDIGRNNRQRQVVSAIISEALSPGTLLNPIAQRNLVGSTADVLTVNEGGSLLTVGRAGLALRSAMGPGGLMGAPPIQSLNHPGPGGSSTVLLAPEADQFWIDLRDGNINEESFAGF